MDNRHINQGGGDLYITYKLQVQDTKYGWYYEPGREFDAEVIDWAILITLVEADSHIISTKTTAIVAVYMKDKAKWK